MKRFQLYAFPFQCRLDLRKHENWIIVHINDLDSLDCFEINCGQTILNMVKFCAELPQAIKFFSQKVKTMNSNISDNESLHHKYSDECFKIFLNKLRHVLYYDIKYLLIIPTKAECYLQ